MRIDLRFLFVLLFINMLAFTVDAVDVNEDVLTTIADDIESESIGQISFYQPDALNKRLVKVAEVSNSNELSLNRDNKNKVVGFRIQVYTNNNQVSGKRGAEIRGRKLSEKFPDLSTHLTFNSPYWRLRVGDFKIKEEAMLYMQQIQNEFPAFASEVRVVKDYITVNYND